MAIQNNIHIYNMNISKNNTISIFIYKNAILIISIYFFLLFFFLQIVVFGTF